MSNKRAALKKIAGKLAKLIPLLASDKPGEVFNTARVITRVLASVKLDLHDLVRFMAGEKATPLADLVGSPIEKDQDTLFRLGLANASFFHSAEGVAFADVIVDGNRATCQLSGVEFTDFLLHLFFLEKKRAPTTAAMLNAVRSLSAYARFKDERHDVHLRVTESDRSIYIDLGEREWRAVEIDKDGWRIVTNPPVRFRRSPGMHPLPLPKPGGSIRQLRRFVNLNDSDFTLLVSVLLDGMRPGKPHPILYLCGEEGSAKSTLAKIVRLLIDPNSTPLRTLPGTVRDLFVSMANEYAIGFDNLSKITQPISDALCQIATGSGYGTRRLYSDSREFLVSGSRPVVLNGLANTITRSDLSDRAVVLSLAPIKQENRLSETEFWAAFEAEHAQIFGAMLDAVACGLRDEPQVRLDRLPRMADFVIRSVASERSFAEEGAFLRAFDASTVERAETLIESDCVATAVSAFMTEHSFWRGTATQLLRELTDGDRTEGQVSQWTSWPRNPSIFSSRLRMVAASLRKVSIELSFDKRLPDRRRTRMIELRKTEQEKQGCNAGAADVMDVADSVEDLSSFRRNGTDGAATQPDRA
jgi:hypothetical protein